jgi:hypothetical protein
MTRVTVDAAIRARLHNFAEPLEILDEEGKVLGVFSPIPSAERALYKDVEVPLADEDIDRLLQQPPGRPLSDILADLQKQP